MSAADHRPILAGSSAAVLALLASPPGRAVLEASLLTHMLVQMPLLVLIGWGLGRVLAAPSPPVEALNRGGVTGLLLALAIAMFWMLPRSMDAVLVDMRFEVGKFVTLPIAGLALAWSYSKASAIVKGVLNAHVVSALGVMGWAYLAAPSRLCNAYLASDQEAAGVGLLVAGLAFSGYFATRILFGPFRLPMPSRRCDPSIAV